MLGFDKLASNARRFRMLMGMSLQEFERSPLRSDSVPDLP